MDLNGADTNSKQANKKEGKEMKKMKAIVSLMLTVAMVLGMSFTTMAAGGTGKSITIKPSATVNITKDSVFKAYKILDAEAAGTNEEGNQEIAYTVPDEMKSFYNDRYGLTGSEADYAYQVAQKIKEETDLYAFGGAVLKAIEDGVIKGIEGKQGNYDADSGNYVIDGLEAGYYVIQDTNGKPASAVMMGTNVDELDIVLKADQPGIDKDINGDTDTDTGNSGLVDKNNVSVGDDVPYVITSEVPSMSGYDSYKFVITDTLSKGLTYKEGTLNVKVGNKELKTPDDYNVVITTDKDTGITTIKIVFVNFIRYKTEGYIGKDIVVTYNATVNDDAVIGVEGNPNTVKLEYSNDPSNVGTGEDFNPDEPKGVTSESTVYSYVTALELTKVNAAGDELTGAQFTLKGDRVNRVKIEGFEFVADNVSGTYYKLTDGTYTETEPTAGTRDKYVNPDTTRYEKVQINDEYVYNTEKVESTVEVGNDGTLTFTGLGAGTYTITELVAPDGYNLLKDPINVTINCAYNEDGTCTWSGTYQLGSEAAKDLTYEGEGEAGRLTFDVVNNTGTELPETGGMGTTLFYVVGAVLVIGAAILLIARRRTENAE